jgi:hypothetical protein
MGQDHPQRGTRHSPMIPSKKSGEKRPQIDESSDKRKSSKIALKMTRKSKKTKRGKSSPHRILPYI